MTESLDDLVFRLRERARIRRQIPGRKAVEAGEPDRIAGLLDEAANAILKLQVKLGSVAADHTRLRKLTTEMLGTPGRRYRW